MAVEHRIRLIDLPTLLEIVSESVELLGVSSKNLTLGQSALGGSAHLVRS